MSVCPNINTSEWKQLEEAVGRFEAYKDFVESGYEIRTPQEVVSKLEKKAQIEEKIQALPFTSGMMSGNLIELGLAISTAAEPTIDDMAKRMALETQSTRAMEIARKLSANLGVNFSVITAEQAVEMTKNTINPWSGQTAFYYGGTVQFIGESLSINSVLHEFSHPFIRQIQVDNPTLFNNLYAKLMQTDEGSEIIRQLEQTHPDLYKDGEMYREEVMVKALEKSAAKQEKSPAFVQFIKDLLFAIKRVLRNALGQIEVSSLNENTTLDELAYMLTNEKFQINTELVTEEDVVAYVKDYQNEIADMKRLDKLQLQSLIREGYLLASGQLMELKDSGKYADLVRILRDQYKRSDLENIMADLGKYKDQIDNIVANEVDAMDLLQNQASAMVNAIYNIDTVMRKIQAHIDDIYKEGDTQDNMQRIAYYKKITKHWGAYIAQVKDVFDTPGSGVSASSNIYQVINVINGNLAKIDKTVGIMDANGARDTLYAELEPMGREIKERYETIIANLEAKGASQRVLDKWHKEFYGLTKAEFQRFDELRKKSRAKEYLSPQEELEFANLRIASGKSLEITPEKIEDLLKGRVGDANWFNSYLEGYMYNNDPIIGGLAMYVKNRMNEVMVTAQSKFNAFAEDMKDSLEAIGFNANNIGELGKKVGFEDEVLWEENGQKLKKKAWTILNPFKNYRHDLQMINQKVDDAEREFSTTGTDDSLRILRDAVMERKNFLKKYFHQPYNPKFYERQALFEKDDIGKVASHMRESIIEKIRKASIHAKTQSEQLEVMKEVDALWREYRQLHSLYDLNGNMKTGNDLLIAQRLRDYREQSRDFYTWTERPGVFQGLLEDYEQEISTRFARGSDEFDQLRDEWIRKNTRVVIKQSWYVRRQEIFAEIKDILSTLPDTARKDADLAPLQEAIIDLKSGFRDEDGQPDPSEMTESAINRIKELELEIEEKKKNYRNRSGLTGTDQARLNELFTIKSQRELTATESAELNALYTKQRAGKLSPVLSGRLDGLYAELEEMSSTEATGYYVDIVNNFLSKVDTTEFRKATGTTIIGETTAHYLLDPKIVSELKAQSNEFAIWYDKNHVTSEYRGNTQYKRVSIWSVIRPSNENYIESTEIRDSKGKVTEKIQGLPTMKFYRQEVKEEFQTPRIVGQTIDNKGNWLPKGIDDLDRTQPEWDKYINYKYYDIKENDPKLFRVIEKLTYWQLKNQEGLDNRSKNYLDFPRFTKGKLETYQSTTTDKDGNTKWNGLTQWTKRVREFWKGTKDQFENGMNAKQESDMVKLDMFDDEVTNIPISGLYRIDSEDVSTDIMHGMMRYMLSAERQKQLVKISPLARAIQNIVNDPANSADLTKINRDNFVNRHIITYKKKKDKSVRARAVNNFIEREFEGINQKGALSESVWFSNLSSKLFGQASFQFFALNIPSAMKNHYSAKFQTMLESTGGKYINPLSAGRGEVWATAAMTEMSFGGQLQKRGAKSLMMQMMEVWDMSQGRFEEKFGDSMSRSTTKNILEGTWLYSPRKWLELQATTQLFAGMLAHQKIQRTMPDGTVSEIAYLDAFELDENKRIVLKSGIDPKWGITYDEDGNVKMGREFSHYKNKFQQVSNNLQGAYSKFDQPEAQRYIAFRFLSYLRRYFTTMTVNRFGFRGPIWAPQPRMNPGLGEPHMGNYIRSAQFVKEMVITGGKNLTYMTREEGYAVMKTISEVVFLYLLTMAGFLLYGWDPDDDDDERYQKLRQMSGALPFLGVEENEERPFDLGGFLGLHILNQLIQVRAENEQFIPLPGYGLDNFAEMTDLKSIALGPTTDTYIRMLDDLINTMQGDESAYYTRDTGPYFFQQQEGNKLLAGLARLVGFTGSTLDPAMATQKFYTAQAMARR